MNITAKHPRPARSRATPAASRTLLLATNLQQSILAELELSGPNRRAYSAYGVPGSQRPTSARLGFNGQITERSTGWYHLGNGHRVYNPVLMRFHSPDRLSPFGKGGINAYAYCEGDPLNFADPTGQWTMPIANFIQPILIGGLHTTSVVGTLVGPPLQGVVRNAARLSFSGSVLTGGAALAGLAGYPFPQVANVGTAALIGGAGVRVVHGAINAFKGSGLWNNIKGRLKDLIGIGEAPKVVPLERVEIPLESIPAVSRNVPVNPPPTPSPSPQTSARSIRSQ